MSNHLWAYEDEWMATPGGQHVGGLCGCVHVGCPWLRFSRAGRPPRHYYVERQHMLALANERTITFEHPLVMLRAPPCNKPHPWKVREALLMFGVSLCLVRP